MSRTFHPAAELEYYGRPLWTLHLESLARAYENLSIADMATIHEAVRSCAGFVAFTPKIQTSDGYTWFGGVEFRVPRGTVLVVLPWAQDWSVADDSRLDRMPVAYTKGWRIAHKSARMADGVVAMLTRTLLQLQRHR